MSAFIVEPACMHRCVQGTLDRVRVFADMLAEAENASAIGKALYAMNTAAIKDRYPHHPDMAEHGEQLAKSYVYVPQQRRVGVVIYKAMRCLLYQCSEGNVPETALYKELEKLADEWAGSIVADLPEYERAPWG